MNKSALFLDRDGIFNEDIGYLHRAENLIWKEGIFELLHFFKQRDYLLLMVTNQSGIHRGYFSFADFCDVSFYIQKTIKHKLQFHLDKIYFCPHTPEEDCLCRKPKGGMIAEAQRDFNINIENTLFIGDRWSDILAAREYNIPYKFWLNIHKEQQILQQGEHIITHLHDILSFFNKNICSNKDMFDNGA